MDIGYFSYNNEEQPFFLAYPNNSYKKLKDGQVQDKSAQNHLSVEEQTLEEENNHSIKRLNDHLAISAQKIRSQLYSEKDIKTFLINHYFKQNSLPKNAKSTDPERYAMYENDLSAFCYDSIIDPNPDDPRLYFDEEDWQNYKQELKKEKRAQITEKMASLTENINLDENDAVLLSFNPYTYLADIKSELDTNTLRELKSAINSDGNSKELFFFAYQNSSTLNSASINKMKAYHSVFKFSGLKLSDLVQKNGNFYTIDGTNIIDVIQKNIEENNLVPKDFQEDVLDNLKDSLENIAKKGYKNTPDLNLNMVYSKKDGFILTNTSYSV